MDSTHVGGVLNFLKVDVVDGIVSSFLSEELSSRWAVWLQATTNIKLTEWHVVHASDGGMSWNCWKDDTASDRRKPIHRVWGVVPVQLGPGVDSRHGQG